VSGDGRKRLVAVLENPEDANSGALRTFRIVAKVLCQDGAAEGGNLLKVDTEHDVLAAAINAGGIDQSTLASYICGIRHSSKGGVQLSPHVSGQEAKGIRHGSINRGKSDPRFEYAVWGVYMLRAAKEQSVGTRGV
jgi:hypothetical protein